MNSSNIKISQNKLKRGDHNFTRYILSYQNKKAGSVDVRHFLGNIVFISDLEIYSEFQGKGLGKYLLKYILKEYSEYKMYIKAKPYNKKNVEQNLSQQDLDKFYLNEGFKKLPDGWMVYEKRKNPRKQLHKNPNIDFSKIDVEKVLDGISLVIYDILYRGVNIGRVKYDKNLKQIIRIDIELQGKGIGKYVYDYIEKDQNVKLTPNIIPDRKGRGQTWLTPEAEAFWKKRLKKNPANPNNPFYREITKRHGPKSWWKNKFPKEQFIHDKWYLFISDDIKYELFQFYRYDNDEPLFYKHRPTLKEKYLMPYSRIISVWKNHYFIGPFLTMKDAINYAEKEGYTLW